MIPPAVPCNFFLGRNDRDMSLVTAEGRERYKRHVLSLIPHAVLHEHEFDHFGRGVEHDAVIDEISDIFQRYDSSPMPPHYLNRISQYQGSPLKRWLSFGTSNTGLSGPWRPTPACTAC